MKKLIAAALMAIIVLAAAAPSQAQSYYDRKGRFQLGLVFPSIYFGTKNIDAMLSGAVEGEYFALNNLSVGFRMEGASDFKLGDSPHSVFSFIALVRYIFDISDPWAMYLGIGGGGALLGKSTWVGDIMVANVGGFYQFNDHVSFGLDAAMHVLVRSSRIPVSFSFGPAFRWRF